MHMVTTHLSVPATRDFNFRRTVYSHGWCVLPPFSYDAEAGVLQRVLLLSDGSVTQCILAAGTQSVNVKTESAQLLSRRQRGEIVDQLRTCLRLDEDFTEFHRTALRHRRYRWIALSGSGRLLRSPTVFEDVAKMICTTNCTWALTTIMVTNLVQHSGKRFGAGLFAFPSPEAIAGLSERELRTQIKAGYRAPYLLRLAESVASGKLDIEAWRTSNLNTDELYREMRSVLGVGPYAAGNLLRLAGHYNQLGLDSWVRNRYYTLYHRGRKVKDSTIETRYEPFGKWRGLFFWLEMTRHRHDEKARRRK